MRIGPTSSGPDIEVGKVNALLAEAAKAAEEKAKRLKDRNGRLAAVTASAAAAYPNDGRKRARARDDAFRAIASEFEGEYEFTGLGRRARRDAARSKLGEWLARKLKGVIRMGKRKAARQGLHSRGLRNRTDASKVRRAARMAAAAERKTARSVVI